MHSHTVNEKEATLRSAVSVWESATLKVLDAGFVVVSLQENVETSPFEWQRTKRWLVCV